MNSAFAAFLAEALREGATDEPGLEKLLSRAVRSAPRKEVHLDEGIRLVEQDGRYVIAEAPFLEFRLRGITRVAARIIQLQKPTLPQETLFLKAELELRRGRPGKALCHLQNINLDVINDTAKQILSFMKTEALLQESQVEEALIQISEARTPLWKDL